MMTDAEVFQLIRYCKGLDTRAVYNLADEDQTAVTVLAWHNELPVDLTFDGAVRIVHQLLHAGQHLTAANIGRRFDEMHTPKHQQNITRQRRPMDPEPRAVAEIETPQERPLTGEETTALLDELGLRNGRRARAWRIKCPHCGARENQACTTPNGDELRQSLAHPSRMEAAGVALVVA